MPPHLSECRVRAYNHCNETYKLFHKNIILRIINYHGELTTLVKCHRGTQRFMDRLKAPLKVILIQRRLRSEISILKILMCITWYLLTNLRAIQKFNYHTYLRAMTITSPTIDHTTALLLQQFVGGGTL